MNWHEKIIVLVNSPFDDQLHAIQLTNVLNELRICQI